MDTWHSIVAELKLPHGFYKPYSLRRGGATSCYKNGCTLDELVTRGRCNMSIQPGFIWTLDSKL